MELKNILDPFGQSHIEDYERLFSDLGLQRVDKSILERMRELNIKLSRYLRRGIDFAHRDFDKVLDAFERGEPIAVMSGIKPTNEFHLGSKVTAEKIIYFQRELKAKVFYCIADLEALVDNKLPLEESRRIAIGNVADLLALGLNRKRTYFYFQSRERRVTNLAYLFSRKITLNHLRSLYGERHLGLYFAALTQAGDILLPQLQDFDGKKIVLVPVGIDQDPHIRLTRDIVPKVKEYYDFLPPAAIYHRFFRSLRGESKMSKRSPRSMLSLSDDLEEARKKVKLALDGGRKTAQEQREKGGEPERCVVFELASFHFVESDKKLEQIYRECKNGERLCGECKEEVAKYVVNFLKRHQRKKRRYIPVAERLLS